MKKLILLSLALTAIFSTSCNPKSNEPQSFFVYDIASIESHYVKDGKSIKIDNNFALVDAGGYYGLPRLKSQSFTNDTISLIEYEYHIGIGGKDSLVARRYVDGGRVLVDSLATNADGMATAVIHKDGTTTPYYIEYDGQSMRTAVGDKKVNIELGLYASVVKEGKTVVTFKYADRPNFIGMQQFSIPGNPYYWQTNVFGKQSQLLLHTATVVEDGKDVVYTFKYTFDSNGFVTTEEIKRGEDPFMRNTYTYKSWVVSTGKPETKPAGSMLN
ncbi:MAG: hypothetical protein RSC11_07455 [Mucinivorans sp.]